MFAGDPGMVHFDRVGAASSHAKSEARLYSRYRGHYTTRCSIRSCLSKLWCDVVEDLDAVELRELPLLFGLLQVGHTCAVPERAQYQACLHTRCGNRVLEAGAGRASVR
jgi:hypothetical protein